MTDWRHSAACRDVDPELFFAIEDGPAVDEQIAEAKAVCAGCPVRAACLSWALRNLSDGIAGGLTPDERRRAREADRSRNRRAAARRTQTAPAFAGEAGASTSREEAAA